MKKLALSLVLGASLAIAPSVFALTSMTDANMKSATGQAGVSIAIDNVVIESWTGSTEYIDEASSMSPGAGGGSIEITDRHVVKSFQALTGAQDFADDFSAATGGVAAQAAWTGASSLNIDIGICDILTLGMTDPDALYVQAGIPQGSQICGVVIGLPTLLIKTTGDEYSIKANCAGAANSGATYIKIKKSDSVMAILGGTLEIAPH
jgi:hypothetical protein